MSDHTDPQGAPDAAAAAPAAAPVPGREKLLAEVIYTILQVEFSGEAIKEKELLQGKGEKLREIAEKFFQCFTEIDDLDKAN